MFVFMKLRSKCTKVLNCSCSKVLPPEQDLHKISSLILPENQKKPLQMHFLAKKELYLSMKYLQASMV